MRATITIYLSHTEAAQLQAAADRWGCPVTRFIREAALHQAEHGVFQERVQRYLVRTWPAEPMDGQDVRSVGENDDAATE